MTAIPNKPKRYTARETADYLGMALNTVYLERASGRLIGEPHGSRSWRFTQEAVDQYRTSRAPAQAVPTDLDARLAAILRRVADEIEHGVAA